MGPAPEAEAQAGEQQHAVAVGGALVEAPGAPHGQHGAQEHDALVLHDPRERDEVAVDGQEHGGDEAGPEAPQPRAERQHGQHAEEAGDGERQARGALAPVAEAQGAGGQHDLERALLVEQQDLGAAGAAHLVGHQHGAGLVALELAVAEVGEAEEGGDGDEEEDGGKVEGIGGAAPTPRPPPPMLGEGGASGVGGGVGGRALAQGAIEHVAVEAVEVARDGDGQDDGDGGGDGARQDAEEGGAGEDHQPEAAGERGALEPRRRARVGEVDGGDVARPQPDQRGGGGDQGVHGVAGAGRAATAMRLSSTKSRSRPSWRATGRGPLDAGS